MSSGAVANNAIVQEALARAQQLAAATTPERYSAGQKRPPSDESTFVPAKRANEGHNQAAMNQQDFVALVETVEIPDSVVGLVIGRGGEQITAIQQQTGCRVQMANDPTPTGTRLCTLNGARVNIDAARQMITEVISKSAHRQQSSGGGNSGGGGRGGENSGSYVQETLLIPGNKCGLIIGRNGDTIKSLQENLGVKMLLVQESQQVSNAPKPLKISGDAMKVANAKNTIYSLINSEDGARPQIAKSIGEVIVPRSSVGIIIGKSGETIKRLINESGCKIQFKPDDDPTTPDRCATLQGTPDQIGRATQMISDLLLRSQNQGQQETFLMHVPANKTGLVIGKGGDTIKQINGESGAHVELSRDPPPNATEKIFVIKGTGYQIHHAQHIIRIKVGDIAPGTPVPHYPGVSSNMGYGNNPMPGFDGGYNQNQWNQPAATGYPQQQQQQGGQNWQQSYYGAGDQVEAQNPAAAYQNYGQSAAAQPQAQQQGAAAAQQDYSAQWIEYYRQMGMHDKAALVEQQAKAAAQGGTAAPGSANAAAYGGGSYN